MKRLFRVIWQAIPRSTLKTKIHCLYYNKEGFHFRYRMGLFFVKGPRGIKMVTHEAPFNLVKYYRLFLKYYQPAYGDIVIDAGTYDGHVCIMLSQLVGREGHVYGFEPDPGNRQICLANMALNDSMNITLVDKGLWADDTVLEFNSNSSKASSVFYQADNASKIRVEVTSLDQFVETNSISACHFVKMNIEGSEIMALKGAEKLMRNHKPAIAVTTDHMVEGVQTSAQVEGILKSYHYKVWTEIVKTARFTYGLADGETKLG